MLDTLFGRPIYYKLDENHNPVPCRNIFEWAEFMRHKNKEEFDKHCRVAQTQVTPKIWVSTVFLGTDHNYMQEGNPILFETMVFRNGEGCECERYCTWKEAEQGHKAIVLLLQTETNP